MPQSTFTALPTVAVFVDGQNINLLKHNQNILSFAKKQGRIAQLSAYHNWRQFKIAKAQKLQMAGWLCIDIAGTGKNRLDRILIHHCQQLCSTLNPDVVVLVTGDKDFLCLVEACQAAGQRVEVLGRQDQVNHCYHRLLPQGVHYLEGLGMNAIS
ncbi:MAG: NYN domain-containing protein [Cyanobacteria bacterium J06649_11]